MFPRQARNEEHVESSQVCLRLVEMKHHLRQRICYFRPDMDRMQIDTQMSCNGLGVREVGRHPFAARLAIVQSDREALQAAPWRGGTGKGHYRARIESAGKKRADGNVGNHLPPYSGS